MQGSIIDELRKLWLYPILTLILICLTEFKPQKDLFKDLIVYQNIMSQKSEDYQGILKYVDENEAFYQMNAHSTIIM